MDTQKPIYEHGFDQETLDDFQQLRRLRLKIAEQQLENLTATVDELRAQGLLPEAPEDIQERAVEEELQEKIDELKQRMSNDRAVFLDEISFYNDFFSESDPAAEPVL